MLGYLLPPPRRQCIVAAQCAHSVVLSTSSTFIVRSATYTRTSPIKNAMVLPSALQKIQHRVTQALKPRPPPAWPLRNNGDIPAMMDQLQSPFFRLSAELRNPIYLAVLSDLERFLHICLNSLRPKRTKCRQLAHWRCTDPESSYSTFQHRCFGEEPFDNDGRPRNIKSRSVTITEDQLLALLLSCRRM